MTEPFRWHHHPDSDEMFIVVEGGLIIEFDDDREILLRPGQMLNVPRGVLHRTRPEGVRSVNLTLERGNAATVFEE